MWKSSGYPQFFWSLSRPRDNRWELDGGWLVNSSSTTFSYAIRITAETAGQSPTPSYPHQHPSWECGHSSQYSYTGTNGSKKQTCAVSQFTYFCTYTYYFEWIRVFALTSTAKCSTLRVPRWCTHNDQKVECGTMNGRLLAMYRKGRDHQPMKMAAKAAVLVGYVSVDLFHLSNPPKSVSEQIWGEK